MSKEEKSNSIRLKSLLKKSSISTEFRKGTQSNFMLKPNRPKSFCKAWRTTILSESKVKFRSKFKRSDARKPRLCPICLCCPTKRKSSAKPQITLALTGADILSRAWAEAQRFRTTNRRQSKCALCLMQGVTPPERMSARTTIWLLRELQTPT